MINSHKWALTMMNQNLSRAQKLAVTTMNQHIKNSKNSSFELKILSSLTRAQIIVMLGERYHWHNKKEHDVASTFISNFSNRFLESWPSSEAGNFILFRIIQVILKYITFNLYDSMIGEAVKSGINILPDPIQKSKSYNFFSHNLHIPSDVDIPVLMADLKFSQVSTSRNFFLEIPYQLTSKLDSNYVINERDTRMAEALKLYLQSGYFSKFQVLLLIAGSPHLDGIASNLSANSDWVILDQETSSGITL